MEKFIPFEKLSKKKQREHNVRERRDWGVMNPVTRMTPNPRRMTEARKRLSVEMMRIAFAYIAGYDSASVK